MEARMKLLENCTFTLKEDVAELKGNFRAMKDTLEGINDTLIHIAEKAPDKGSLVQKVLMGSLVVQGLIHGLTSPDAAKAAITQIFGGSH